MPRGGRDRCNGLVGCAIMALSRDHEARRIGFTCCLLGCCCKLRSRTAQPCSRFYMGDFGVLCPARRSHPLIRRALFRRSSTIRVAMLRRRRCPCWRAGVPAPCLACVLSRPSKTAPALDSLRSLLASSPCLLALASRFRAVRVPPRCRNRLLAIVSNLFLFNLS